MRLAIMQPYFFPYLGYYRLLQNVDKIIWLTDVQFNRQGWVHRNQITGQSGPEWLTLPIKHNAKRQLICEAELAEPTAWHRSPTQQLKQVYGTIPSELENLLTQHHFLVDLLIASLDWSMGELDIKTTTADSRSWPSAHTGRERIIELCKLNGATTYVNLSGGQKLYLPKDFAAAGIELEFMKTDDLAKISILDQLCQTPSVK